MHAANPALAIEQATEWREAQTRQGIIIRGAAQQKTYPRLQPDIHLQLPRWCFRV